MASSERKKQLKAQYLAARPEMGILMLRCLPTGTVYLQAAPDVKGRLNRVVFSLNFGNHYDRALQEAWNQHGEAAFEISVLDTLDYDEDPARLDYREDLETLLQVWLEKLEGSVRFR
ncbi:MAG: GIY-YIG nuclease family protein [Clostridiales bacterium]|nr:GIY-YIG nuclease family protein [Clostridiales bacterium]